MTTELRPSTPIPSDSVLYSNLSTATSTPDNSGGRASPDQSSGPKAKYEWKTHGPSSPVSPLSLTQALYHNFKRRLGPTELSYYLGSRGDGGLESGVNDMYLQIGFKCAPSLATPTRLLAIWSELLHRHALLGSTIEFRSFGDVSFCYEPLSTQKQRLERADSLFEFRDGIEGQDVVQEYLNGPRTLSDARLSYLVISSPLSSAQLSSTPTEPQPYHFNLFSTHFIGDGMALHATANEFFALLSTSAPPPDLSTLNIEAVERARAEKEDRMDKMAVAVENDLPVNQQWNRLGWAAAAVDFENQQNKLVGGHSFAKPNQSLARRTVTPSLSYSLAETSTILRACKAHGTTIAHATFSLVNMAFIRSNQGKRRNDALLCLIYSALNVRNSLVGVKDADWYRIAISYYNIMLPTFLPSTISPSATFWHRALSTKIQTHKITASPLLPSRAMLMALEREKKSIGFEVADEIQRIGKGLKGLGISHSDLPNGVIPNGVAPKKEVVVKKEAAAKVPSTALMGVSMLGNLDAIYSHAKYHSVELTSLATGSRQRRSAILLFAFTFNKKLEFSLGYDQNGFEAGVVEAWWEELEKAVRQFMLV